jgi:5'-deoxynucleotidase YfbR-like HD superfamily hydrolase
MLSPEKKAEKLLFLREAGAVERSHACPHHGSYSIAQHSFQMAMIVLTYHPSPSLAVLEAVLLHDVHERVTGDIPAPARWSSPELKEAEHGLRDLLRKKHEIMLELPADEKAWLNSADRLELFLWARDQLAFGNRHIEGIIEELKSWFRESWSRVPDELKPVVKSLTDMTTWKRGSDRP